MSKPETGGSAFPLQGCADPHGRVECFQYPEPGMTLRQWYAGQALAGYVAGENRRMVVGEVASLCFRLADAMIAEGSK